MSEVGELATWAFLYDRADLRALAEVKRPRIVGYLFVLAWILFAAIAFLIAICWFAGSPRALDYAPPALLLLVTFLLLYRFGSDIRAWALEVAARRSGVLREQVMTVADGVFRAESERGKTEVRWTVIPRVQRAHERLFVFSTPYLAFIVPRRAFADEAAFDAFAAAAEERWTAHHRR